jgi:hypothetical protein
MMSWFAVSARLMCTARDAVVSVAGRAGREGPRAVTAVAVIVPWRIRLVEWP